MARTISEPPSEFSPTVDRLSLVTDGFANAAEACKYLCISRAKLYALMEAKELAYAKLGKSRRIPWQSLHDLAARSLVG